MCNRVLKCWIRYDRMKRTCLRWYKKAEDGEWALNVCHIQNKRRRCWARLLVLMNLKKALCSFLFTFSRLFAMDLFYLLQIKSSLIGSLWRRRVKSSTIQFHFTPPKSFNQGRVEANFIILLNECICIVNIADLRPKHNKVYKLNFLIWKHF